MAAAAVTRYTAGPGTGKTHTLLSLVEREAEEYGTRIGDLAFATFARSQAEDVKNRIRDVYPDAGPKDINTAVSTIHAAALRACRSAGLLEAGDRIIVEGSKRDGPYFEEFAELHNLPYSPALGRSGPDDDPESWKKGEWPANALYKISRYIVGQYAWGPENADDALTATGTHIPSAYGDRPELLEAWAEFKADQGLYEHDDYIRLAIDEGAPAPAAVVMLDEFQDLSPLQAVLSEMWRQSGDVDRLYVAGDPNQAIYGFRGADPIFLEEMAGPIEDIGATADGEAPLSRRCPAEIVRIADLVLGGRSNMRPRAPGGVVEVLAPYDAAGFAAAVEDLHRQYGAVMVLARYQRDARRLSKALTAAGLPHSALNPGRVTPWQTTRTQAGDKVDPGEVLAALDAIEVYQRTGHPWTLERGPALALTTAGRLQVPPGTAREYLASHPAVHIADVLGWFGLEARPEAGRSIAAGALDFGETFGPGLLAAFNRPDRPDRSAIVVDTIHAAKGGQARAVVLHTGYQKARAADYWHNPAIEAEERRVYYVGITRASEALVILDGLRSGPSAPPAPPLQAIAGVRS